MRGRRRAPPMPTPPRHTHARRLPSSQSLPGRFLSLPPARLPAHAWLKRVSAAVRAHRVATSSAWAPYTRNRPAAAARVGGSSCRSRWRPPPLAENGALRLLGARFSPRGRTEHVLRAAWVAKTWLVLHGHDTGRGHGAAGRALSLVYQPACALNNGPYLSMRTSTVWGQFEGLDESGGEL